MSRESGMRVSLAAFLVGLIVTTTALTVGAVVVFNTRATNQAAIQVAHGAIQSDATSIAERTDRFLASASATAGVTSSLIESETITESNPEAMLQHFLDVIDENPDLSGIHYGTATGDFYFAYRGTNGTAYETKVIQNEPRRTVTVAELDAQRRILTSIVDPLDAFDPRVRTWYIGAAGQDGAYWTPEYVFFTTKLPGVTASRPVHNTSGDIMGVVGVDILLNRLGEFLAASPASENASAYLISDRARVVAASDQPDIVTSEASLASFPTTDAFGNTALAATWDEHDAEPLEIPTIVQSDGERFHSHFTSVATPGVTWQAVVQIPESDYVSSLTDEIATNSLTFVLFGLISVALGLLSARLITKPMGELAAAADTLMAGDAVTWPQSRSPISEVQTSMDAAVAASAALERRLADLRSSELRADAANRSKSEFLTAVSHELRTPLTAIIGFSSLLEEPAMLSDGERADHVTLIRQAADHLLQLINDILDIAKVESGEFELLEDVFDLAGEVDAAARMMGPRARLNNVAVMASIPDPIEVRCDKRRTRQVLLNLMSNAVKFTEPGGSVDVSARTSPSGDLLIEVVDTGLGMTPEQIEIAMQPFRQVNTPVATGEGSGLGLPLTNHLVESLGGTLTLTSEPGVGTTATVTLPNHRLLSTA